MARTIAVSDDVYQALSRMKLPGESYSDVIRKALEKGASLSDIAGSKTLTKKEWRKIVRTFEKQRVLDEERKERLLED